MKPETIQLLKNLGWGALAITVSVGLAYGVWHFVRVPALTIDAVIVTGGETVSHAAMQTEVEALLDGAYSNFIPKRFVYTYPQEEIAAVVGATPRVRDPQVSRQGRTVRIALAEFEPVALWCDAVSTASSTTSCVFLDEFGYGFAVAPNLTGGTFTRFVRVGETASTSQVYADTQDFDQLRALEDLLVAFGWPVEHIELDQARDAFVYIAGGGQLKVALELSPTQIMDNLRAVLSAEQYQDLGPGEFEYIDLRFGNKVFVNQFGAPVESATSTASTTATTTVESLAEIE